MKPLLRILLPFSLVLITNLINVENVVAQEGTITVFGTVFDAATGEAVPAVAIVYAGQVVARTEPDGQFRVILHSIREFGFELSFERLGYTSATRNVSISADMNEIELSVELTAAPTALEEIVVEGERIMIRNPGLVGFYNRREEGYGRYMTEPEIERSKGFDLTPYFRRLRIPSSCSDMMPLVVYLDGRRVEDLETVNRLIPPNQLGGIEAYVDERKSRLPQEFVPAGPHCGVVMLWTREPKPPSWGTVGLLASLPVSDIGGRSLLVGGHVGFPLKEGNSTLEFRGTLMFAGGEGLERWRMTGEIAFRPFVEWWFVGTGATIAKERTERRLSGFEMRIQHSIVNGLDFNLGAFRPFIEARVMHSLMAGNFHIGMASGINVTIGR